MKRIIALVAVIAAALVISTLTLNVADAAGSAGSEADPLVSQSYVDSRLSYSPLQLTQGQKLYGKEGTEIIMRSGVATAIDNGANGVSDVTMGSDLMTGDTVALNHMLITPRDDRRGIEAHTEVWVLVRGDYTVE